MNSVGGYWKQGMPGAQFHQYHQGHLVIPDNGQHYQCCQVCAECDFPDWAALANKMNEVRLQVG